MSVHVCNDEIVSMSVWFTQGSSRKHYVHLYRYDICAK